MVKAVLYAYCIGVASSRRIAQRLHAAGCRQFLLRGRGFGFPEFHRDGVDTDDARKVDWGEAVSLPPSLNPGNRSIVRRQQGPDFCQPRQVRELGCAFSPFAAETAGDWIRFPQFALRGRPCLRGAK